jgi:hypothetical protein
MRILIIFRLALFLILLSCNHYRRGAVISKWSDTPSIKAAKIKVTSNFYNDYAGLHAHCLEILNKLHFELQSSNNPISTKSQIIYNGTPAKYYIQCDTNSVIIWGQYGGVSLSQLLDNNSNDRDWRPIVKGPGQFGTPWFDKMMLIAQTFKDGKLQYSER